MTSMYLVFLVRKSCERRICVEQVIEGLFIMYVTVAESCDQPFSLYFLFLIVIMK